MEKSVGETCWRRELQRSVREASCREKCWREFCREVLEKDIPSGISLRNE